MELSTLSTIVALILCGDIGIVNGQGNFNCSPVCFLAEWICSCEATNNTNSLTWNLIDLNTNLVGEPANFVSSSHPPNATVNITFAEDHFIATFMYVLEGAITSVATGTVSQSIDGYSLQCGNPGAFVVYGVEEISIPDAPSQPENLTATTDPNTGVVLLSWTPPINSAECVVGYIINSTLPNSTVSFSTTLNHTLIAVCEVLSSCTYTASVAANDTAGRIGNWSQVLFSFNGSSLQESGSATPITISVTPTISSPLRSTASTPTPPGLCANGAGCLVIGITVAIAVVVVLIMVVVSSLIAYLYFRKRKGSNLIMDSKESVHSSGRPNSETESTEQPQISSTNAQAYQCPSDATKEYNQQKWMSENPKSEYASPQDAHCAEKKEPQFSTYQEIEQLNKQEHHGDGGFSAQEKRATTTLNRSEIIDIEGYSDLPAHNKKSSAGKKPGSTVVYSDVELQALPRPPPPPPQSAVEYTSLQTVEYAVVQKKKETQP